MCAMDTGNVGAMADGVEDSSSAARAEAFRLLADRHLNASYGLAYVILGDAREAEDATHDAFVQAWRKWSTLRDRELFQRWFDRILVNTCRNRLRRGARRRTQPLSPELEFATPDVYGATNDRVVLAPALSKLAPDQRVVVALRFYRDLSVDQIAERIGVPSGTVKSRLHRAMRELRAELTTGEAKVILR
jgi:RNA polymerase sigma factor (sigma-70 family)